MGFAAALPVSRKRRTHAMTVLIPTPKIRATSRRDVPPSTAPTTRSLKSCEYGLAIRAGLLPSTQLESQFKRQRNPKSDSASSDTALDPRAAIGGVRESGGVE